MAIDVCIGTVSGIAMIGFCKLGYFLASVLPTRALLLGVHIRAPDYFMPKALKPPYRADLRKAKLRPAVRRFSKLPPRPRKRSDLNRPPLMSWYRRI